MRAPGQTQRDQKIAEVERQVRELVRRLDALQAELEATKRAHTAAICGGHRAPAAVVSVSERRCPKCGTVSTGGWSATGTSARPGCRRSGQTTDA